MFGRDAKIAYRNGAEIYVIDNDKVFKTLKQSPASYLWYLLLTFLSLDRYDSNGEQTNTTPINL